MERREPGCATGVGAAPRKKRAAPRRPYLRAPLALGIDGSIIANLSAMVDSGRIGAALDAHRKAGRTIFVGVVLTDAEARDALAAIDDAAAELVAWLRR
jgi:hypothetical protein